jgi:PAS domain S-box-containing protein
MSSYERDEKEANGDEEDPRFRLFFENAPLYCYLVSPQGILLDLNKAALEVLGYRRTELIGKHIRTIYAPEYEEKVKNLFSSLEEHDTILNEELIIQSRSGDRQIVLLSASAIRDTEGSLKYSISVQKDITELRQKQDELKNSQQALKKSEQEKSIILDSISEHVIFQDIENRIIWANRAAAESINLSVNEIIGKYCFALWQAGNSPCDNCPIVAARETGKIQEQEMESPDGRIWLVRGYPIYDDNNQFQGCVEVTREITEQKRVEEAYRKLVDQSIQGLFIMQESKVVFANPAFLRITGYSEEDIIGFGPGQILEIIHPDDRNHTLEQLQNIINGKPVSSSIEIKGIVKDGSIRWFELSLSIIEFQGKLATQATIMDIHERKIAEDTIRLERDRAQRYLNIAGVMFIAIDRNSIITLVNKKALEIFGYSEEEMIGQNYFDLCIPESHQEDMKRIFEQAMSGSYQLLEFVENPIIRNDGTKRIVLWHTATIKDNEGNPTGIISSGEDITEQKLAETALKASEERFRSLVEDTAGWVWEVDCEYRFIYSNSSVEDLLGYTAGQIIGRGFFEYLDPMQIEEGEAIFAETLARQKPFKNIVNRFLHRDGNIVILEASGRPIFGENGQLEGFRGVCRDITQRIRADDILRESEARYRALVETSPDSITLTDLNGIIKFVNERSVQLLGFNSPEELLGKNCFDFIIPEERNNAIETLDNTRAHGPSVPVPFSVIHRNGTIFPAEISASLLIGAEGKPTGYIIVTRNITERKASEQALQEAKAQAEFFTDLMAHDLNNINQAILSALELQLMNPDLSEELKAQLQLSLEQVERSAALIGRVKKFSGMDEVETLTEVRDIEPDFQSALETVKQAFPEKTVLLDTNIYPDEYKVLADDLLVDLFFNVLHNAVKFDQNDKIEIEAKVYTDTNKRYLRVEISDHGPGIPDDLKERIFARYTQRIGKKAQGSGIGLTLVQRIVDRYGGRIWVEDRVIGNHTKGAKFVFLLPMWN